MKELIKKLVEVSSPSGREDSIRETIINELEGYVDEYRVDAIGNLIVRKAGSAENPKKILLDGHADEIGVVITNIDKDGFLRIDPVGGVNPLMLLGAVMRFRSKSDGSVIRGIVSFESETARDL